MQLPSCCGVRNRLFLDSIAWVALPREPVAAEHATAAGGACGGGIPAYAHPDG